MNLTYISYQKYFHHKGHWYAFWEFPFDLVFKHLNLSKLNFWGRLYDIEDPSGLVLMKPPKEFAGKVCYVGPKEQGEGVLNHVLGLFKHLGSLRKLVRGSDVVWLQMLYSYPTLAWYFCKKNQVTIVGQGGDPLEGAVINPKRKWYNYFRAWQSRRMSVQADIAVFVSRSLAELYADSGDNVLISNNSRIRESMLSAPRNHHIDSKLKAIFIGRISKEKSLEDFILAMSKFEKVEFTIVGTGYERGRLEALAQELGCSKRIHWLGKIAWGDKLFDLIRDSDLLVLPSATEGMPKVVLEAMSQSIPVLVTNVGGIPEVVKDGISGFIVNPGQPDELVSCLRRMLEEPNLINELAKGAFEAGKENTVEKQFGFLLKKIAECYAQKKESF
jgi:glycosyltransferase involved in cell wall biosynthesis